MHTKGKLEANEGRIDSIDPETNEFVVANCYGKDYQENARRLVACWNRLLPFPTEQIEEGIDLIELVKERDELVRALRGITDLGLNSTQKQVTRAYDDAEDILAKYPQS